MTRRTEGPKRRAEKWADDMLSRHPETSMRQLLAAAYMAGYRSAIRARKIKLLRTK